MSIIKIGIGRYIYYSKDTFATDIFKQSILGSQIIAILLLFSFIYGLSFELQNNNRPNISLNIIQMILSFSLIILPYIVKDLRKLSNIFSILVLMLAIAEMETQFHDVYLEFYDAKSWLANLALMAAFAFFYVGTPLQFFLVWITAFIFYSVRSLIETQFQIPTQLTTMLSTIVPLAFIWIVLNGFWFRIRLKQLHIQADLTIANQKLTEIDRLRSNFFAGISHEFRTPLTLMLSPLQDMLTEAKNSHWLTEYLKSVERNGSRLLVLVNNLIDLARIDAGRMHLRLESIDLCQHIRGIISLFDQSFKSKGLTLKALLPLQLNVQIDIEKFETILMNLLINALQLTKSGGANIQLDLNQDQLWLTVTDTGAGIPTADKDLIFEYFATLYPSRQYAGLGLALSREFARFLGGDLTLVSTGAEGSTFLLNLPIRPTISSQNRQTI
ncbi:MAG: HAMP domain-containing histidine kinase, partial [Leptonema sp. (in: Bacteria)]|nr:HAMP domain-containing histidine kinase [Leptonema sp. (in: bacteria)]